MGYQFHSTIQGDRRLPPVLFLHGFLGSNADFNGVIASLSEQFCCLAVDLPGHGNTIVTGAVEQYTMSQTAQAVIDWLDRLALPHCYLVGYSMGGRLALYLAIHFATRFPSVVLESASPGLKTDRERQARLQQDWALADQIEADFASFLSYWYQQPLFHSLRPSPAFADLIARRSHNSPAELAKALRYNSTGNQPSLWHLLPHHTQPLLLLVGEDDRKFVALNQAMQQSCPISQLQIIPDCGHVPHLEQPDCFIQQVSAFFSNQSGVTR